MNTHNYKTGIIFLFESMMKPLPFELVHTVCSNPPSIFSRSPCRECACARAREFSDP